MTNIRKTAKSIMLNVMSRHPQGLTAAKIAELTREEFATEIQNIRVYLSQMTKTGDVVARKSICCTRCGTKATIYRLRAGLGSQL